MRNSQILARCIARVARRLIQLCQRFPRRNEGRLGLCSVEVTQQRLVIDPLLPVTPPKTHIGFGSFSRLVEFGVDVANAAERTNGPWGNKRRLAIVTERTWEILLLKIDQPNARQCSVI